MLTLRRSLLAASGILATVLLALILVHATATNLSLPDMSGTCSARGTTFTTAVTADSLAHVFAWQVNITWAASQVTLMSYAIGSAFTSGFANARNGTGYYLLGFSFQSGNSITAGSTTIVTFTWKTLVYHAGTVFHFASNTALVDSSSLTAQAITTTDGVYTCALAPGK